jgi:hypothetical protein
MEATAAAQLEGVHFVPIAPDYRSAATGTVRMLVLGVEDVARIHIV